MRAPNRSRPPPPSWQQLLVDAVTQPGVIAKAYSLFHNYSVGNQLAAWMQLAMRKLEPGPIHSFKGWLKLNRHVKRGETALVLCMPVSWTERADSRKRRSVEETSADAEPTVVRRRFVWRPYWFALCQTEGEALAPVPVPTWDESLALDRLQISKAPFQIMDGNCQGYASDRTVAISPIAFNPHRTLFHEVAHVLLGHTAEGRLTDTQERTPKSLREAEAECVAMLCCCSLGLPGEEHSRGYIQHWFGHSPIPESSAQKIFHAADRILRAGRPDLESAADTSALPA